MSYNLKITVEDIDGWYDWIVEGDRNSRGPYCGGACNLEAALNDIYATIRAKQRHPYNPKARTEY